MTTPDQFEYIKLEVLTKMDFLVKSNKNIYKDLIYNIFQSDPKNIEYQSVFNQLERDGLISSTQKWPTQVGQDRKNIGFAFNFSIINKKEFNKLYLDLSEKYKYYNNKQQKTSISYSSRKGIFLTNNPNCCYGIRGKRKEIFETILNSNGSEIRLSTLKTKHYQENSIIVDAIRGINKLFSKKVVKNIGEKIIIQEDSSGYLINKDKYDVIIDL